MSAPGSARSVVTGAPDDSITISSFHLRVLVFNCRLDFRKSARLQCSRVDGCTQSQCHHTHHQSIALPHSVTVTDMIAVDANRTDRQRESAPRRWRTRPTARVLLLSRRLLRRLLRRLRLRHPSPSHRPRRSRAGDVAPVELRLMEVWVREGTLRPVAVRTASPRAEVPGGEARSQSAAAGARVGDDGREGGRVRRTPTQMRRVRTRRGQSCMLAMMRVGRLFPRASSAAGRCVSQPWDRVGTPTRAPPA